MKGDNQYSTKFKTIRLHVVMSSQAFTPVRYPIANFRGHGKIDIGQFYLDFFI